MCTQTQGRVRNANRRFRLFMQTQLELRAVVLGAALALLLAATPASRGGTAPPVGTGLARLVRLDRAGFPRAGV